MFIDFPFLVTHHSVKWKKENISTSATQPTEVDQSGDSEPTPASSTGIRFIQFIVCTIYKGFYYSSV